VDLVVDRLLLFWPTVAAADDAAPNEPAVKTMKASEQKLNRFNLCIIGSVSLLKKGTIAPGFVPNEFISTGNAGIRAENPHRGFSLSFP